jgi:hypothetical protein
MFFLAWVLSDRCGADCNYDGRKRREHRVFTKLLQMVPGLEERLMNSSEEEVVFVADLVGCANLFFLNAADCVQIKKGASSARSDDTKSLKSAIIDWITPRDQALTPALTRNVKVDRRFQHERTGTLLCPADMDWSNAKSVRSPFQNPLLTFVPESSRGCAMAKHQFREINGRFFYTLATSTIRMIRGPAFSAVPSS